MLETIAFVVVVSGVAIAGFYDLRTREIPNEITYGLFVLGVLFAALTSQLGYALLALVLMIPFVALLGFLGGMGAGDAKLLLAISLFLGVANTLYLMPVLVLVGALCALLYLSARAVSGSAATWKPLPFAPAIFVTLCWVLIIPYSLVI